MLGVFALFVTACDQPTGGDGKTNTGPNNTYTIIFDKNATDASGSMENQTLTSNVAQSLTLNSFTRTGYAFSGWNMKATGGGTKYADGASVSNLASVQGATVTLYAQWEQTLSGIDGIVTYLNGKSGGASAADPVSLPLAVQLSATNWSAILTAINTAGKYVSLNLSACTASTANSGGGLRSTGDFDPVSSTSTGKSKIVNLTLPDVATGIVAGTSYSNTAFKDFTALKTVSGAGVTSIGNYAFCGSSDYNGPAALTSVSFPAATAIGSYAFYYCGALTSVSFPAATAIVQGAFRDCTALTSVSFPAAASIGFEAFRDCAALTSASFPAATAIGSYAFYYCGALTSVSFPAAASIGSSAFQHTALTSASFPAATTIGSSAFQHTALTSVSFPAAAAIYDSAFSRCPNLRFTLSGAGSLSTLEEGKMLIKNSNELLAYPAASGAVTLPNSITRIGDYTFYDCTTLTSVSAPAATAIGDSAFYGCAALTSVSAPAATAIDYYAFRACTVLTSVTLGATPPTLRAGILFYISARTVTVRIPTGSEAAYGVPNLPQTNFDNSSTDDSWGRAFKGKGWNGIAYQSGTVNNNITLVFETYAP